MTTPCPHRWRYLSRHDVDVCLDCHATSDPDTGDITLPPTATPTAADNQQPEANKEQ